MTFDRYLITSLNDHGLTSRYQNVLAWRVCAFGVAHETILTQKRIVVRNGFSMDLANLLLADLRKHVKVLEHHPQTQPPPEIQHMRESFKH